MLHPHTQNVFIYIMMALLYSNLLLAFVITIFHLNFTVYIRSNVSLSALTSVVNLFRVRSPSAAA